MHGPAQDSHRTHSLSTRCQPNPCPAVYWGCSQVAAFAMGRGPLAMSQFSWARNLLQFGVVLSLPVIPKDGECEAKG